MERDVHDSFQLDGLLFSGGRPEFPLAEGRHGIGIQNSIEATHQLNAIHRAVFADDGVKHDFAFHAVGG